MRTRSQRGACALILMIAGGTLAGCQDPAVDIQAASGTPSVTAQAAGSGDADAVMTASLPAPDGAVAAGRYLVVVAGCNDCHTDGYLPSNGAVPESEWLKGSMVGFSGPWGTTYPSNLRLAASRMTEDQWVQMLGVRTSMPPMPWPSVAGMRENDRRAIYRYIRSLGEPGDPAPANLPPGREPTTPWIDFVPRNMPQAPVSASKAESSHSGPIAESAGRPGACQTEHPEGREGIRC